MTEAKQYQYSHEADIAGDHGYQAHLPIQLFYKNRELACSALLDTGSTVNVLPYEVGVNLGLNWEEQNVVVPLTGNLAQDLAKGVVLRAVIDGFEAVDLVFAWSRASGIPILLGQVNFFMEFDVCQSCCLK